MGIVQNSFSLMLIVSGTLHLGVVVWCGLHGDTPPRPFQPLRGRMSIELAASVAASPNQDTASQPTEPVPDALLQSIQPAPPEAALPILPEVRLSSPQLPPPQTAVKLPRPELPKVKLADRPKPEDASKPPAAVASVSSAGSKASEGADGEETPQIRTNPVPPYPADALAARWEGRVVLRVMVDAEGRVESARLQESSGVPSFDDSALTTVYRWRFHPGRSGGVPVAREVNVPIRFELRYR